VCTSLGGGQFGHLFLILTVAKWNALVGTMPGVEPADPGPFVLPGRNTPATIALAGKTHDAIKKRHEFFWH